MADIQTDHNKPIVINPIKKLFDIVNKVNLSDFNNDIDKTKCKNILELLLYFENSQAINDLLNICITSFIIESDKLILRSDSIAISVLVRFIEICLDPIFNTTLKMDQSNIPLIILHVTSLAPVILRKTCRNIFNRLMLKLNNEKIAYRAICTLVCFRYILPKIIFHNISNKNIIMECKRIQTMCNFNIDDNDNITIQIMSSVQMLCASRIGAKLDFKLELNQYKKYLVDLGIEPGVVDSKTNIKNSKKRQNTMKTSSLPNVVGFSNNEACDKSGSWKQLPLDKIDRVVDLVEEDGSNEKRFI
jgi:hypothetical protein